MKVTYNNAEEQLTLAADELDCYVYVIYNKY